MRFLGLFLACMDASRPEYVNRLWFYNFYEAPLIFGSYFKFWCASYQNNCFKDMHMLLKNILGDPRNWLSIILGDS